MPYEGTDYNRRTFLKITAGAGATAGLAGCSSNDGGDGGDGGGSNGGDGGDGGGSNGGDGDGGDGGSGYPHDSVELIIPWGEGGGTDVVARGLFPGVADNLGISIQYNNVPGGDAMIGTSQIYSGPTDGTVLGCMNMPTIPLGTLVHQPDFVDEPSAVAECEAVAGSQLAKYSIFVNADVADEHGIDSFDALMDAYADGTFTDFGLSSGHVPYGMVVRDVVGLELENFIRYEGAGPAVRATAQGEVPAGWAADNAAQSGVESGNVKMLAIAGSIESNVYPDVPTLPSLGYPNIDYVAQNWRMYWYPPGTSSDLVQTMSGAIEEAINNHPDVQAWQEETGQVLTHKGPEEAQDLFLTAYEELQANLDMEAVREEILG